MYFKNFPYTQYQFPDSKIRLIQNLSIRPSVMQEFIQDGTNLKEYVIEDGMTPETIAFDEYGDATFHWVILMANNILNVYEDWPKTTSHFEQYLHEKYKNQFDSDGNPVELDNVEVSEFVEFVGTPSNGFSEAFDNGVVKKPHHFEDDAGNYYSWETAIGEAVDAFGRQIIQPTLYPKSIFDEEFALNERKRVIILPNRDAAMRMKREMSKILNE